MDFRVRVEGGADDPTASELTEMFADWLAEDRAVGAHADIVKVRPSSGDGGMSGKAAAWIALATSSRFSPTALVNAHQSFRASLPPRVRAGVRLVIERNGTTITVEGASADEVARVAHALGTPETAPPA